MLNWTLTAWPILAGAALKSTLVLGAAWWIAWLLRGRTAAARHMVWTAAAAALLALPLLSVALPALRVRVANAVLPADAGLVFRAGAVLGAEAGGAAAAVTAASGQAGRGAAAARNWRGMDGKTALLLLWLAGIAAGLLQILAASAVLWWMRREARVSPDQDAADRLAARLGIGHAVRVLETRGGMPMTFGVLRPTILLPEEARAWSGEQRRVVLLHELGHVLRGDAATHLVARAALTLHWWNPLAWAAWREFLKERERATDDLVLRAGAVPTDYAGHLLEIARTMQMRPASAAAGLGMARRSQLEGRLLAILDGRTQRGQQGRAAMAAAAALGVAMIAPLAAVRAQSPAEQGARPEVEATIRNANAQKNHEMLDRAAATYEQERRFAEAQRLRQASLAMAEQLSGTQSKDYAIALIKLGDLARKSGTWREAEAYYRKALELGDRPEAFSALIALGRQAARVPFGSEGALAADPVTALDFLQRARNVAGNGNEMGTALTAMAGVRQDQPGGEPEAESLYRSAMASEDADSAEQALTLELYSQFLKTRQRTVESEPIEARAKAIRRARIKALGQEYTVDSPVRRVGGGVKAPSLLHKVEPAYSEEARFAKQQGTVLLKVVIDVDGRAKDIQVMNGLGLGLDEQAAIAIQKWLFKPGEQDGVPVPVLAQIEVNFRLK